MKRECKHRYVLPAVGLMVLAAKPLIWEGPMAIAQEPGQWCDTYEAWVAEVGNQRAVAQGTCPTMGACDTPSVRDAWTPGPSTPVVTIRIKFHVFYADDPAHQINVYVADLPGLLNGRGTFPWTVPPLDSISNRT